VSYVLARKKIKDLQKINFIKERIAEHIFKKLAKGEGVIMRDLYNSVIPELSGIMDIQRSALFSINRQKREVVLEAGYPEKAHGIGKTRSEDEPFIQRIIDPKGPYGEFEHERIYPNYILIVNPQRSHLIPQDIRYFLETQNIHSVLYLPLKKAEEVNYFLTFDAQGQHKGFSDEEIELFLFLGMELIKGLRLERLHDLLHDSKNIGISLSYFTKRIQNILKKENYLKNEKLNQAVEIILEESNRLQGLFQRLFSEEKEAEVDPTEIVKRRFLFYKETMKEMKREHIRFVQNGITASLRVRCNPSNMERVIDNLLSNATIAVPDEGGEVSIRVYQEDSWAVMEIANTGRVLKEEIELHLRGEEQGKRKGRGLHICNQLAENMGGRIDVEVKDGAVIFRVRLPAVQT
jgi:signal transduction histidine kinase